MKRIVVEIESDADHAAGIFVQRGNAAAMALEDLPEEIRAKVDESAILNLGMIMGLLQVQFGLHVRRVTEMGQEPVEWGYHWHDSSGCLVEDERAGFVTMPAAVLGGIFELLHDQSVLGALPVLFGLRQAGLDLVGLPAAIPPGLEPEQVEQLYASAMKSARERLIEMAREQPSGFAGEVVAEFLDTTRQLVKACVAEAREQVKHDQMPIPRNLYPGFVAVPAVLILAYDHMLRQMGDKPDAPSSTTGSKVARSA